MTDNQVIDPAAVARLQEWGGPKLLRQMIRLYLENAEARLEQIERGYESGDPDAAERGAHSLKSSAGNVGAVGVARLAREVEERTGRGELDDQETLMRELREEHRSASVTLREIEQGIENE